MEEQTFNKTFPKEDISKRLANLEQKTFNKTYTDDLSTRVDRLKAKIKPQSLMNNQIAQSSNSFYDQEDVKKQIQHTKDSFNEVKNLFKKTSKPTTPATSGTATTTATPATTTAE